MPRARLYDAFKESEPFEALDKKGEGSGNIKLYVSVECPHCTTVFTRIPETQVYVSKAMYCKKHLAECEAYHGKPVERKKKRTIQERLIDLLSERTDATYSIKLKAENAELKRRLHEMETGGEKKCGALVVYAPPAPPAPSPSPPESLVTVYKIIYTTENRAVYTGRTKHPERRLREHRSASSKCRLLRNAIRCHGIGKYVIEPIIRCHESDADVNESHYIMANNTLYPNGYNLRHGSKAGVHVESEHSLVPCGRTIRFKDMADEMLAQGEVMQELGEMCSEDEGAVPPTQVIGMGEDLTELYKEKLRGLQLVGPEDGQFITLRTLKVMLHSALPPEARLKTGRPSEEDKARRKQFKNAVAEVYEPMRSRAHPYDGQYPTCRKQEYLPRWRP